MSLLATNCKNCGANIEMVQNQEIGYCPHCGTSYITTNSTTNNINNNITHVTHVQQNNRPPQYIQPQYNIIQPKQKSGCGTTFLVTTLIIGGAIAICGGIGFLLLII